MAAVLASAPQPAQAVARKVALVIGISQYVSVPSLTNPKADADAVTKALRDDGFDVNELTGSDQLDRTVLWAAIKTFRAKANGTEAAVIYYAGHGVEANGRNWLLPRDAKAGSSDEIEASAIPSALLIEAVSGAGQVRLVILDACRDNPFNGEQGTRSVGQSRGLKRETNLPPNVVVLLATQPGLTANDGKGTANSPFAQALATALTSENLRISSLPTVVSRQMRLTSGIDQRPDQQGIFDEPDWMFRAGAGASAMAPAALVARPAAVAQSVIAPPAPAQIARGFGLVLQSRTDGGPGLLVVEVANGSPFDGTVQPGDVILKLNSATPPGPQSVIGVLEHERRASINLQHGGLGVPTSTQLTLPKETDE